jgi:hypothetical protein
MSHRAEKIALLILLKALTSLLLDLLALNASHQELDLIVDVGIELGVLVVFSSAINASHGIDLTLLRRAGFGSCDSGGSGGGIVDWLEHAFLVLEAELGGGILQLARSVEEGQLACATTSLGRVVGGSKDLRLIDSRRRCDATYPWSLCPDRIQ